MTSPPPLSNGTISRRDRLRTEIVLDIKRLATESIASEGASGLSLRSIARDLGVAPSALYRYFPSRDALLGELIGDAYDGVADAVERAITAVDGSRPQQRWHAAAHAARGFGLAEPKRWALIYGTPIPGYHADPGLTKSPGTRMTAALTGILTDAVRTKRVNHRALTAAEAEMHVDLVAQVRVFVAAHRLDLPVALMVQGIAAWSQLIGLITFELFGHLEPVIDRAQPLFDLQIRTIGRAISFVPDR